MSMFANPGGFFGMRQRTQRPSPEDELAQLQTPEQLNMPTPPPGAMQGLLRASTPPTPPSYLNPERTAPLLGRGETIVGSFGDNNPMRGMADMQGGSRQQTQSAMAGLERYEGDQFSPFSEFELSRLATRDPNTVAPGSNQVWQNKLNEMQSNHKTLQDAEFQRYNDIQGATASMHPAVQMAQRNKAMADSMGAQITARGQMTAADIAGRSRVRSAETLAQSRKAQGNAGRVNEILGAIARIHGKTNIGDADLKALQWLRSQYDLYTQGANEEGEEIDLESFISGY